jgi:hypothetical protein
MVIQELANLKTFEKQVSMIESLTFVGSMAW